MNPPKDNKHNGHKLTFIEGFDFICQPKYSTEKCDGFSCLHQTTLTKTMK